ncbi:MAG: hypothetical protein J5985_03930 [Kiritimatiellae bacterium]|nr:hypothetical protein [Kiritimatiellia bacterium]
MFSSDFFSPVDSIGNALLKDADAAYAEGDKRETANILKEGAEAGHPGVACAFACLMEESKSIEGFEKVDVKPLLKQAAKTGLPIAMRMYADAIYSNKRDATKAHKLANRLYTLAAAKGERKAVEKVIALLAKDGIHYDAQTVQRWAAAAVEQRAVAILSDLL